MIKLPVYSKTTGTNLLELSASVAILTFGVLGTIVMLHNAKQIKTFAQEYTIAILAASEKTEEILANDWEKIFTYNNIPLNSFFVKGLALPQGATVHGQVQIDTDYELCIHTITVIVTWKNIYGKKNVTIRTRCAK